MNTSRMSPMGRRIHVGMAASGIASASDLARRVGVSHQTARRWLYVPGAHLDAETAIRLADVVHLSLRWLVYGKGVPTPRVDLRPDEAALVADYRRLPKLQRSVLRHCAHDLRTTAS